MLFPPQLTLGSAASGCFVGMLRAKNYEHTFQISYIYAQNTGVLFFLGHGAQLIPTEIKISKKMKYEDIDFWNAKVTLNIKPAHSR